MASNLQKAKAFASKFNPPLTVVPTQNINGVAVRNGVLANFHDPVRRIGIVALWWGKDEFKAYIEIVSGGTMTEDQTAKMFAKVIRGA